jgi:hypothetical protein
MYREIAEYILLVQELKGDIPSYFFLTLGLLVK